MAVAVNNSTISFGLFQGKELSDPGRSPVGDVRGAADRIVALAGSEAGDGVVAVASVNVPAADELVRVLEGHGLTVGRVGRDIPLQLTHSLEDASTLGQDRILCAIAAFDRLEQACIIIDAGTAVTVDFIDGEGTFHGGGIAPGIAMMLRALHEHTAALPDVPSATPLDEGSPFGQSTAGAMVLGVHAAVRGMAHTLIERFSVFYGSYPTVIATGGDAARLFGEDELIDRIIPDLQLFGIQTVFGRALIESDTDEV